jgi:DNA-binding NarL/FixJ family response regulator
MVWRILVADDNPHIRSALNTIFHTREDWVVCGEAANGQEAVELTRKLKPDAVVLDFRMPEMNGLEAATKILKESPSLPIILYSLHDIPLLEKPAKAVGIAKVISKADVFTSLTSSLEEILPATTLAPSPPMRRSEPPSKKKRTRKKDPPTV